MSFSFDNKYWNYTLDDQARIDIPQTIDFILKNSRSASRVSIVDHSAGGTDILMALSLYPEELTRKVCSCILWSPAYAFGNDNPNLVSTYPPLLPISMRMKLCYEQDS